MITRCLRNAYDITIPYEAYIQTNRTETKEEYHTCTLNMPLVSMECVAYARTKDPNACLAAPPRGLHFTMVCI